MVAWSWLSGLPCLEKIALRLWREIISLNEEGPRNFTLVAWGDSGAVGFFHTRISTCFFFLPTLKPSRLSETAP
jgi:hypothetical protein